MQKWRRKIKVALVISGLFSASSLWAALPEGSTEITEGAKVLKEIMAEMPYTSQGEGPVIYSLEFSECPHSQRFYSDWKGKLNGVQMRRLFYAVSQRSANETAALAASRDPEDYQAYMEGRKTAQRFDDTHQSQQQIDHNFENYQSVMKPLVDVVTPILVKNGAIERNLVSPMLIWERDGRVFASGGYDNSHIESVLAHISVDGSSKDDIKTTKAMNEKSNKDQLQNPSGKGRQFDILGLTLSMTPDEIEQKMAPLNATLVDEKRYVFSGTDIEFLASQKWKFPEGSVIDVRYARPPEEPVVIGLIRDFRFSADNLPDERLRGSIQEKYGKPDFTRDATAGAVLTWYDGSNADQCSGVSPGNAFGSKCPGPLLTVGINSRNSASGRISSIRVIQLHDHAAIVENLKRHDNYGSEIARRVEQERMKENQAPNF